MSSFQTVLESHPSLSGEQSSESIQLSHGQLGCFVFDSSGNRLEAFVFNAQSVDRKLSIPFSDVVSRCLQLNAYSIHCVYVAADGNHIFVDSPEFSETYLVGSLINVLDTLGIKTFGFTKIGETHFSDFDRI